MLSPHQLLLLVLTGLVVGVLVCCRHQICSALGSGRWPAEQFAHQVNRASTPVSPGQLTLLQTVVGVLGG